MFHHLKQLIPYLLIIHHEVLLVLSLLQLKLYVQLIVLVGSVVRIVVTVVVMFICFFYNNPTSKENSEHTGAMRLEKKQKKGIVDGENFFDDIE